MSIPRNNDLAVSIFVRPKSGVTFLSYGVGTLAGQRFPENLALGKCHPWTVQHMRLRFLKCRNSSSTKVLICGVQHTECF